jgi:hypothetical protein
MLAADGFHLQLSFLHFPGLPGGIVAIAPDIAMNFHWVVLGAEVIGYGPDHDGLRMFLMIE